MPTPFRLLPALLLSLLSLSACTGLPAIGLQKKTSVPPPTASEQQQASLAAQDIFQRFYQLETDRSPVLRSRLGYDGQFEWDDISAEAREQQVHRWQALRAELAGIREDALTPDEQASYRALLSELDYRLLLEPFTYYDYGYSQLGGWHTEVVNILTNYHPVRSIADMQDYITRLETIPVLFKRWQENIRAAEAAGIIPPAFVYASTEDSVARILSGEPFSRGSDSPLWADARKKLDALHLYPSTHELLQRRVRNALLAQVKPAYDDFLQLARQQKQRAPKDAALSRLPDGMRYYQLLLAHYSNSQLDAGHIHQQGLDEVKDIQAKIRKLMPALGYKPEAGATLRDFYDWMNKKSARFADTAQGRDEFIAFQKQRLNDISARLPYYFTHLPATPLSLKMVEDYRAASAPVAFYEAPALDGSRPGVYYMNPLRMNDFPRERLPALAYHEAIPGHHMQISLTLENDNLPEFRRLLHNSALSEGWALYAEQLAGEMGGYHNAEEEYGQLVMALWRAVRLVLDTGLNAKGWSREQALKYRLDNTPFSRDDSIAAINRYLVMPGQAVAYSMGAQKIAEIRGQAEDILGRRFDLAAFHSALLSQGAIPLDALQRWMLDWATAQRQAPVSQ